MDKARHLKSLVSWFVTSGRTFRVRVERFVELRLLKRLIDLLDIDVVLDVGARRMGRWSRGTA
ncbi:hypothetical protein [Emcibacter sp. SYSU 3D8]|uniref:hypothetical protein n=1 Tax=Emcibacter sp. SYSU 3D8 TaxID=3133969 RepID=UPI0031FEF924